MGHRNTADDGREPERPAYVNGDPSPPARGRPQWLLNKANAKRDELEKLKKELEVAVEAAIVAAEEAEALLPKSDPTPASKAKPKAKQKTYGSKITASK